MRIGIDCLSVAHDYVGGANTFLHGVIGGIFGNINEKANLVIFCPQDEDRKSVV